MADHVAAVCRSCYYQLRQLRSVARSLSAEAVKTVVHAFISSRLDYCNSLLTGVNEGLLRRLQSVQNAAARLVTGTRRCEHITLALRQLHWLPVRQRIQYKLASLAAFRALSGLALDYLAGDCISWLHFPDGDPCGLRSDASAMYNVRTAPSVTVLSLPPARAHGTSCRSAYATLGYRCLLSTNI